MKARDIFGVGVRLGGLVLIVFGLIDLVDVLIRLAGLPLESPRPTSTVALAAFIYAFVGLLVFASAGVITSIAYGRPHPSA